MVGHYSLESKEKAVYCGYYDSSHGHLHRTGTPEMDLELAQHVADTQPTAFGSARRFHSPTPLVDLFYERQLNTAESVAVLAG